MSSVQSLPPAAAVTESPSADGLAQDRRGWLEILAISLAVPLVVWCIHPQDPLLLRAEFPWLVLLPLLIGVQHGALGAAVHTALLLALAWAHEASLGRLDLALLAPWAGGCLAAGVIAGYSRDRAHARLAQLGRRADEGSERLARLSRSHAVLRLSHQSLEQRLSAQAWSIEGALEDLRRELAAPTPLPRVCESILHFLSNHAMAQVATLFTAVSAERPDGSAGELAITATLGSPPRIEARQRLIVRALTTGHLVALDPESSELGSNEQVLAAVPLVGVGGQLIGVIAIHEMPFMAFQATNLRALAVLCAELGALLQEHLNASASVAKTWGAGGPRELVEDSQPALAPTSFVGTRTGTRRRPGVARSA